MPEQHRSSKHTAIAPATIRVALIDLPKEPIGVCVKLDAKAEIKTAYGEPVEYWMDIELPMGKN